MPGRCNVLSSTPRTTPDYEEHGISTIKYQKCRLGVLVSAFKHGLVPLYDPCIGLPVQIVRACALCAAFKYGLTPAWKGAMTTFSEETTKAARVVTRETFGSRYRARYAVRYRSGDGKLDVSRRIASHRVQTWTLCLFDPHPWRGTRELVHSISNDKGRNAHSRLVMRHVYVVTQVLSSSSRYQHLS
jgi:hypothetical protein